MKRLAPVKIDDAKYYERIWQDEIVSGRGHFDRVRQEFLASKVKRGMKVVDLGAGVYGTGQYIAMSAAYENCIVVCYDQSYTAREIVLKQTPHVLYLLGDLPQTYFGDQEFDCVIIGEVIEHMDDPAALVAEMARICRKGGWMTMTTVDTSCEQAIAHGPYPEHLWEFDRQELIDLFSIHGKVEYRLVGNYHGILCCRS